MKGVIFTKFIEMVDGHFSPEMTEQIIEDAQPPSGGAYTAVGVYDHSEILGLVTALSQRTGAEAGDLVRAFGHYLFRALGDVHPEYIEGVGSSFDMLEKVHDHIHVEVRKLYPDAELPSVICERRDDNTLVVNYSSPRPFAAVAEGLIAGCIDFFGDPVTVKRTQASDDGCSAVFELTRAAA